MNLRHMVRHSAFVGALLLLVVVGGWTLSGALQQLPRVQNFGQRVETAVQLACSLLSLLAVVTCFWRRRWASAARAGWAVSLAATTGLSALVWGPPMPGIALLFAAGTLFFALAVNWTLRWAQTT
jgi:hypothetical protein